MLIIFFTDSTEFSSTSDKSGYVCVCMCLVIIVSCYTLHEADITV